MEVAQKLKNKTTIWPSNSTLGYTSKGNENRISWRHLYSYVHWSIIHNRRYVKQPKCPSTNE